MPKAKTVKIKSEHKFGIFAILVTVAFILAMKITQPTKCTQQYRTDTIVKLMNGELKTEIVESQPDKTMGLSGRRCIDASTAMLFMYDTADRHGIWMKDMNFAIDILWLDAEKRIVHIEKDVSPNSYPKIYYPDKPAAYVVEVQSGLTDKRSIVVGQLLSW